MLLIGIFPSDLYPQTFARSGDTSQREPASQKASVIKLRDAVLELKSRYRVNVVFEENLRGSF